MFKLKGKILGIFVPLLSIFLLFCFSSPSRAAQFQQGDYTLSSSEIIEENLYVGGAIIEIDGVVDGDLFVAAETITISGTITGDLYAAGNSLEVTDTANIYGSAYLAGQSINVKGDVLKNLVVAGAISNVSGSVGKDLTVFGATSTVSGPVTEDVRVFANKSTISDYVKGEVLVYAESSTVDKELVTGEIYEHTDLNTEVDIDTTKIQNLNLNMNSALWSINIFSLVIGFVAMYIVGIVIIYLAPVKTLEIEKKVISSNQDFLFSFLVGLGIIVFIPLPLIMLSLTVVGIPLTLLITAMLIFASTFGTIWVESAVGHKILSKSKNTDEKRLLSLLIGRGITTVVKLIPIVRGVYMMILSMTALGAIVRMKYDAFKTIKGKR
ncbi:MAG: polymer-forming cytoskeletal protein [Candidatus Dojkabacteria bacterium]|nr:polymer-forming cytoskeletal protein [Candidatus Dojkabacteria bacterium]